MHILLILNYEIKMGHTSANTGYMAQPLRDFAQICSATAPQTSYSPNPMSSHRMVAGGRAKPTPPIRRLTASQKMPSGHFSQPPAVGGNALTRKCKKAELRQ
ncbi:MAG: hypothetical protein A2Y66_07710 [Nitrospirae bacterium RBG_13_41_22]|nr:MAG: hypothetical protein A2Y66_07710 [Nitrospirae bacterium RBG_13_41_22]